MWYNYSVKINRAHFGADKKILTNKKNIDKRFDLWYNVKRKRKEVTMCGLKCHITKTLIEIMRLL